MAKFSLVNILLVISLVNEFCGGSSLCQYNDLERSTANCANLRLTDVPAHLSSNLIRLDLPKNEIKKLEEKSFARYPNLKVLQLQRNYISHIESLTFLRLKYLNSLYLDQNEFEDLNFYLPETVERLSVRSCRIKHIGKEFLQGLKYLESFDISDNRLTTLPADLFLHFSVKAIELSLDFSSNSLATLTKETVKSLITDSPNYSQLKINLMNNPMHCNCLLKWIPDFRSDPYRGPTILDVQGVCSTPGELQKTPISELRSSELKCVAPVILNDGENFHFSEHTRNAKIHCKTTGDPMPYVFFHISGENGGTILFAGQSNERFSVDTEGSLIIREVKLSDAGNILCIAGNVVQNTTANLMLDVSAALSRVERAGIVSGVVIVTFFILLIIVICCVCCCCPGVPSVKNILCCRKFRRGSIEKLSDNKFSREMNISSANSQRDSNLLEHEEMVELMSNNSGALENVSRLSFARDDPFHSSLSNSAKSGFQKAASSKSLATERTRDPHSALLDANLHNDRASKNSQSSEHSHNQNSHFVPIRRPNEQDNFDDYLEQEDDDPRFETGPRTSSTFGSIPRRGKYPRLSQTKPTSFNQTLDNPNNRLDGQMYPPRTDPTPGFCVAKLPGGSQLFEEPENFVPNSDPLTLSRRPKKPPSGKVN